MCNVCMYVCIGLHLYLFNDLFVHAHTVWRRLNASGFRGCEKGACHSASQALSDCRSFPMGPKDPIMGSFYKGFIMSFYSCLQSSLSGCARVQRT